MLPLYESIKGIHPGAILKRELKKRNIKSIELARLINEYPQTINAVTQERRGINPKLSIKLGQFLGTDNDYFMLLQASYEVKLIETKVRSVKNSLSNKIRRVLFWDTDFDKIDWEKNKRAVIKRVLERGNENEIKELISFYGLDSIKVEIKNIKNSFLPSYQENVDKFINRT